MQRLSLVFLVLFASCAAVVAAERRPNVILIMADDMGYECVGANGCTSYQTPHLDRLAKLGMRFTHCYSQPLCTPSRLQIMTGKYNFRNYERFGYLSPREKTFGHLLQDTGYETCIAGKWQLNGINSNEKHADDPQRPRKTGFDQTFLWQVTNRPARYKNPQFERNGELHPVAEGGYGPELVGESICDFITANREQPFFVYYPMILPHSPYVPTPDSKDWEKDPELLNKKGKYFGDMVAYVDKLVGKIAGHLEHEGVADNTLLMFTCDNGTGREITTQTTAGPVKGGKSFPNDAGMHVPLIVSWPGVVPAGAVCTDLVDFTDFLPTILQATATSPPSDLACDGRSFLPQLHGEAGDPRQWIACWYNPRHGQASNHRTLFVRDKRYKLYHDGRLFDLRTDPEERAVLRQPIPSEAAAAHARLAAALGSMPKWNVDDKFN